MKRLGIVAALAALPLCCIGLPLLVAAAGGAAAALIGGTLVGVVACAAIFMFLVQRKRSTRGDTA